MRKLLCWSVVVWSLVWWPEWICNSTRDSRSPSNPSDDELRRSQYLHMVLLYIPRYNKNSLGSMPSTVTYLFMDTHTHSTRRSAQ
ncbi:hypothetical protein DM02DRAFT_614012 [Periconia macrospinosa]|uniref:Secreted protein n=1 Tax=Periconia macrospinosa TaxID=97972 RepID=A0A2V1DRQ7_9PLEO|nr:hypothetical protein DM02DRAFT_614012 [Periconia macrospinosa]